MSRFFPLGRGRSGIGLDFGPVGALVDPSAQQPHLLGRQFGTRRRHDHLLSHPRHQADQLAMGAVARNYHRAGMAAFQGVRLTVEPQTVHLLRGTVTNKTARFEKWLDVADEINLSLGGGRECPLRAEGPRPMEREHQHGGQEGTSATPPGDCSWGFGSMFPRLSRHNRFSVGIDHPPPLYRHCRANPRKLAGRGARHKYGRIGGTGASASLRKFPLGSAMAKASREKAAEAALPGPGLLRTQAR